MYECSGAYQTGLQWSGRPAVAHHAVSSASRTVALVDVLVNTMQPWLTSVLSVTEFEVA